MKLIIGRVVSILITGGGWALAGVRTVLDLIGYSTSPEDVGVAVTRLDQFLGWILSLPWWVPWGFAIISTAWLMWVSWPRGQATVEAVKQVELGPPASPAHETGVSEARTEEPKERQWAKTSDYDLPFKLRAIDELLDIVGSEKEFEIAARKGELLARHWKKHFAGGGSKKFLSDLEDYRVECAAILGKISKIRTDNEKYEDVWTILTSHGKASMTQPLRDFMEAIRNLGEPPSGNFDFFITPYAADLGDKIKRFGRWRFEVEKALLARRKELSG